MVTQSTTVDYSSGLYICLISLHGLIRGANLELGKNPDTGGQTKYVVDLAKALSNNTNVAHVDLITRKIIDPNFDADYAQTVEPLNDKANIVRIECGPDGYITKEDLWEHLDILTDNLLAYLRKQPQMPAVVHSHYADAGYVATRISHLTEIPLVHTGHSLGRDKRKRLMAAGVTSKELEERFNIKKRIDAEEEVLANADLVITSTSNEIEEQYELYDFYYPDSMKVIPPGTNLDDFHPPRLGEAQPLIAKQIRRFLDDPDKPIILALSRPDPRKNISSLLKAFGESKDLQELANLVIIAGNRDDINKMEEESQAVLTDLLVQVDYYDLYGKVAIPKKHLSSEVPAIYRLAANSGGVFVNPAYTEPFGLTLLESAASGLPFIATENGGPVDIVKNCKSGLLIDPSSPESIATAIKELLYDGNLWRRCSESGITNVTKQYSWATHVKQYLAAIKPIVEANKPLKVSPGIIKAAGNVDRLIVTDLDRTLLSDVNGLEDFITLIKENKKKTAFCLATARRFDVVLSLLKKYNIPKPDILISSLGTEIYYSSALTLSSDWAKHVDHNWNIKAVRRALAKLEFIEEQSEANQSRFKISFDISKQSSLEDCHEQILSELRKEDLSVNVFISDSQSVDITPARASKGLALRYVAHFWDIPMENILVASGAGTDEDLMAGNTLAVVTKNRKHEKISALQKDKPIYFSEQPNALGIIEAIEYYNFFAEKPVAK